MSFIVGCDVGGTFTDFCGLDTESGAEFVFKVPSTPDNPARAIVDGLERMLETHGIDPDRLARLEHGTTVGTNTLIQRKGSPVALITTEGFRDLLEIGRQVRPHNYSLQIDAPAPLVPRDRRLELSERVMATGEPRKVPTQKEIDDVVAAALATDADAYAVCFLFSFLNPDHEKAVKQAIEAARPDAPISISAEVLPEFREYERLSTTVLNAYLQPALGRYLQQLELNMGKKFPGVFIGINQSSGGLMSVESARRFPVRTALSGPAAGVAGAIQVAKTCDEPHVITLDMGGTSADVCLLRDYAFDVGLDHKVAGFPIRLPVVDVNTVGAGGGSIAWIDEDGLLKVGPLSAGSVPGPACYGRGGTEATVTDANLVLGRLSEKGLISGTMPLDAALSRMAFERLSDQVKLPAAEIAHGVVDIVVANMVRAIRTISTERGHDPRECVLMPFGGAGPLHGVAVARELGISRVVVPQAPGILCAKGLVVADLTDEFPKTVRLQPERDGVETLEAQIREQETAAAEWFANEKIGADDRQLRVVLDMRYVGQNYEIPIELGSFPGALPASTLVDMEGLRSAFMQEHDKRYGFFNADDPLEIVNIRVRVRGRLKKLTPAKLASTSGEPGTPVAHRDVSYVRGETVPTPIYDRSTLLVGQEFTGPAIVEQMDTTIVIYPGDRAWVEPNGNLIIEVKA